MTATLTGAAATRTLQLYSNLGAGGYSFDAGKVARATKTVAGRLRLAAAIKTAKRVPAPGMTVWVRLRPAGRDSGPHASGDTTKTSPPDQPRPARAPGGVNRG